jgi:hypothetical protein
MSTTRQWSDIASPSLAVGLRVRVCHSNSDELGIQPGTGWQQCVMPQCLAVFCITMASLSHTDTDALYCLLYHLIAFSITLSPSLSPLSNFYHLIAFSITLSPSLSPYCLLYHLIAFSITLSPSLSVGLARPSSSDLNATGINPYTTSESVHVMPGPQSKRGCVLETATRPLRARRALQWQGPIAACALPQCGCKESG